MKVNKLLSIFSVSLFYGIGAFCSSCLCAAEEDLPPLADLRRMTPINEQQVREYPHSAVLSLEIEYRTRNAIITRRGTGFAIDHNLVVTAAHAIYHPQYRFPTRILCYQSRHGEQQEQAVEAPRWIVTASYINAYDPPNQQRFLEGVGQVNAPPHVQRDLIFYFQAGYDYAFLYLNNPLTINRFLVIPDVRQDANLLNSRFCGYPGAEYNAVYGAGRDHENAPYPYETDAYFLRQIRGFNLITYQTRSYRGMSGSPARYMENDGWLVNSILSRSYNDNDTICCELVEPRRRELLRLMEERLQRDEQELGTIIYQ